ncbi:MAG: hypothetical protein KF716_34525 [Anaerolineae bacterium]|nr:hypothetical protein [Anaerolineae bacterium]
MLSLLDYLFLNSVARVSDVLLYAVVGMAIALCTALIAFLLNRLVNYRSSTAELTIKAVIGIMVGIFGQWLFYTVAKPTYNAFDLLRYLFLFGALCGLIGTVGSAKLGKLILTPFNRK